MPVIVPVVEYLLSTQSLVALGRTEKAPYLEPWNAVNHCQKYSAMWIKSYSMSNVLESYTIEPGLHQPTS